MKCRNRGSNTFNISALQCCLEKELHILRLIWLPQFSRVTCECNKKELQFSDWTPQEKESGSEPNLTIVLWPVFSRWTTPFCTGETRQEKTQTPAYVLTLCCFSSYLLSSEQLAGNISPTSGAKHFSPGGEGTEHLCSSMLIWLRLVIHQVHQFSSEACLFYLHTTTPLILLINLQMWHLSPKCSNLN